MPHVVCGLCIHPVCKERMNKELKNEDFARLAATPDMVVDGRAFNVKVRVWTYTSAVKAARQAVKADEAGLKVEIFPVKLTEPDETRWCVKAWHPSYK